MDNETKGAARTFSLSTPQETAVALGVSLKTIYYWVGRREIPFLRVGRHLRFNICNVIEYFQAKTDALNPACRLDPGLVKPNSIVGKGSRPSRSSLAIRDGSFAETEKE